MPRDTGFPLTDAQFDFARARRRAALSRLTGVLRRDAGDVDVMLPFEEVVQALGRRGERYLGLQSLRLDSVAGTVDRGGEFDRKFRPRSSRLRPRWERIAEAQRRGKPMPPIDVYRVGDLHFVKDGHHRVSVARALGHTHIDAYVTEVETVVGAGGGLRLRELPLKSHERIFRERVPLPPEANARIVLHDESRYAALAEGVEAWGFRVMRDHGELLTRERVAELWFHDEYEPVVEMLREADLIGSGTPAEAYMHVAERRFVLLRTHVWDDEVIERLREALR